MDYGLVFLIHRSPYINFFVKVLNPCVLSLVYLGTGDRISKEASNLLIQVLCQ